MLSYLARYLDIRINRALRRPPKSLPIVLLWITDKCNLNCRMCGDQWRADLQADRRLLNMTDITGIVEAAKRLKTMVISVTGGEPLLHPQIFEILELIAEAGIAANMCTNGTLLNKERVAKLAKTSLRSISISLDSPQAADHDRLRGREGAFASTVDGVRLLKEAMPELTVNINCTLSRQNFREVGRMVDMAADLGCAKISFAPIHTNLQHKEKPKEDFDGMIFEPEDLNELGRELAALPERAGRRKIRTSSRLFLAGIPRLYTEPLRWHTCYAGYASCSISPWGDVSPCVDMTSDLNVRRTALDEIWRSAGFQNLRKKVDLCQTPCWDTTNTEVAIRFSNSGLIIGLKNLLTEFRTYTRPGK